MDPLPTGQASNLSGEEILGLIGEQFRAKQILAQKLADAYQQIEDLQEELKKEREALSK